MCDKFATAVVDPSTLFRQCLVRILEAANFHIVYSTEVIDDSIFRILAQYESALLIIGAGNSPEAATKQVELLKESQLSARITVVADKCCWGDVLPAFRAGADAYLTNITSCDAFIKSLELVMLGKTIVPSEILPFILEHEEDLIHFGRPNGAQALECEDPFRFVTQAKSDSAPPRFFPEIEVSTAIPSLSAGIEIDMAIPSLSAQEQRILHCLTQGNSNKVIARKMKIAEATVKVHVKTILRKIRAQNRTQAAVWWATQNGLPLAANGRKLWEKV